MEDLQGHEPTQRGILSEKHDGLTTATEFAEDPVGAYLIWRPYDAKGWNARPRLQPTSFAFEIPPDDVLLPIRPLFEIISQGLNLTLGSVLAVRLLEFTKGWALGRPRIV